MSRDDLDPTPTGGPPMFDDDLVDEFDDIDEEEDEADGAVRYLSVEEFLAGSSEPEVPEGFRSGFVSLVGRPNVGKSTLLNRILGHKVSIVSDKPQTTRHQIRGVLNRPATQIVFVDTPGIHKPRTLMGERLNEAAIGAAKGVDVVCLLVDATAPVGRGDAWVAERVPDDAIVIVNKVDLVSKEQVMKQLLRTTDFGQFGESNAGEASSGPTGLDLVREVGAGAREYFPVSAATGEGVEALVEHLISRLPEGPKWYPDDMVTDVEDAFWVAELVREKLLAVTHDELPHSIACRVTEWEWPRVRVEILVERESQKGIVIGKKGAVLKQAGIATRAEMPPGAFLELHVKVDKDWQRRPKALDRLGY